MKKMKPKLYWVETEDHDEDWFIVATSARSARAFHEQSEGYNPGDAFSKLVCSVPDEAMVHVVDRGLPCWPTNELLLGCGAELLTATPGPENLDALRTVVGSGQRIVRIRGVTYVEGDIVGNVEAALNSEGAY